MPQSSGPQRLSQALTDLIALRGYARVQGDAQLQAAWAAVAGGAIARQTRAQGVKRGVLHVSVASAPLLSELAGFYRANFLERLHKEHPDLRIRDLKFRLDSGIGTQGSHPGGPND